MRVTAKVDYAVRALVELAHAGGGPLRSEDLATAQGIPAGFLRGILADLRRGGLISGRPGASGGFRLAVPAEEVTLARIVRVVEGPLADVRGVRPHELDYDGSAEALADVWIAVRAALRDVLDHTTIADVATGELPAHVRDLAARPGARGDSPGARGDGPGQ